MTLHDYLRVLRRGWALILVGLLIGVIGGAVLSIVTKPKYVSTNKVFVSLQVSATPSANELVSGNNYAQQKVKSYIDIVTSPSVLQPVVDQLGLNTTPQALARDIKADSTTGTVLIEITASDSDPQMAANIANATASSLQRLVVDELERPPGGGTSLVKMQTVQPAVPSPSPASPNLTLNLLVGALVGLVLGVGAAFLRTALDTRVHGRHDVEAITLSPVLGGIVNDPDVTRNPLVVYADPRNPRAEAFRALRTNLRFVNVDGHDRSFVITSSIPGEGKSTTATNLAIALADSGARVVLIDGDLRLPRIANYLGIEGAVGLTDVLIGRVPLGDVLQRWGEKELYVLPSGQVPPNPSELLGSEAMVGLLTALNEQVDYVLIDSPPLLPVTDAAILSNLTSGTIVVAAAGKVKKNELIASLRALDQTDSRLVGIVLTMLPAKGPDAYGSDAYSYYGGAPASTPRPDRSSTRRAARDVEGNRRADPVRTR